MTSQGEQLRKVSFRDKTTGWKNYSVGWHLRNGNISRRSMFADPYMVAFLHDFALRLSCYECKFGGIIRFSDLTIADFWGVGKKYPDYDRDDKGTSLVLINTEKGRTWFNACRHHLFFGPADIETAIMGNPNIVIAAQRPPQRDVFYHDIGALPFDVVIRKYRLYQKTLSERIISRVVREIKTVIKTMIKQKTGEKRLRGL